MPVYRRKYNKRTKRYYYKRRPRNIFYRRSANKALRLAKYAVSNLNVEYKNIDTNATQALGTTGYVHNLIPISQGDGPTNRDGKSVKIKSLFIKGTLQLEPTASFSRVRILVVMKINVNLNAPAATDVLDATQMNSLRNLNNTDNIKVLYDKRFVLDFQKQSEVYWQFYKKLSHRQQYTLTSTGGVASNLERFGFFLIAFSDEPTLQPTLLFNSRARFIDN